MDVRKQIERYKIPKATLAALANTQPATVSRFLRDRTWVNAGCAERIEQATRDIVAVIESYAAAQAESRVGAIISLNLRDVPALRRFIAFVRKTEVSAVVQEADLERQSRKLALSMVNAIGSK
jgi:DNA-binding LacI/PurR family transcriptional regulator